MPNSKEGVNRGYTYVVEPSLEWMGCILDKTIINAMKLKVESKGYIEWRVRMDIEDAVCPFV